MRPEGRLPNFLVIGAMKAGSTSLYNYLREHPQVFMTSYKEPEFFVAEKNWDRGVRWYESLFSDAGEALAVGEASTSYTKFTEYPGVPQRIASVIPDARLIYILRNPVDRIRSMYEHMVITGREGRPIDEAVLGDDIYIGPSLYAENIRRYLELFPREQLHVALTDDLVSDVQGSLSAVTRFLGLPAVEGYSPAARTDLKTSERRPDRRLKTMLRDTPAAYRLLESLPAPLRKGVRTLASRPPLDGRPELGVEAENRLRNRLAPDLEQLQSLLGPGFDAWGLLPAKS
ncbi:MAG: sulfotransferase family protein [Actinomycetes bacterium]